MNWINTAITATAMPPWLISGDCSLDKHNMPLVKVNAMSYAQLIKSLMPGCYTLQELADESGLHYLTVCEHTRALHKAGVIHICMWEKDARGRDAMRVYKLGEGRDAKRQTLTQAQRQARVRARAKMARLLNLKEATNDRSATYAR